MRDRPEWMSLTDYQILRALADPEMVTVLTPSVIAFNLSISRTKASQTLIEFVDRGLATRHKEGYYEISDDGRALLEEIDG